MPTAVEHGIGVKAIIAVLRKAGGDPDLTVVHDVGPDFGGAISSLNFTMPTDQHFGGLLLPAVQHELGLLGVAPFTPDDGFFVI